MTVEPMTDAPHRPIDVQPILDRLRIIEGGTVETVTLRPDEATAVLDHIGAYAERLAAIEARLDAERTRADAAEAERRRWHDIETAPHEVLVLLYCPDRGPANRERIELGYASSGSRNDVSSSLSRHAWATKWKPLPDLPTPTAAQEG